MDSKVSQKVVAKRKPTERKPYSSPVLTEYGKIHDLTQGGGGVADDNGPQTKSFLF
jgi:hypothetical protein